VFESHYSNDSVEKKNFELEDQRFSTWCTV